MNPHASDIPAPLPPAALAPIFKGFTATAAKRTPALRMLTLVRHARAVLESYEFDCALAAREGGATWREVGEAVGMPLQNAHRRYGDPSKRPTITGNVGDDR